MGQRSADAHAIGDGDALDTVELAPHGEQFGVVDLGCVPLASGETQNAAVCVDATVACAAWGRNFTVGGCGGAQNLERLDDFHISVVCDKVRSAPHQSEPGYVGL